MHPREIKHIAVLSVLWEWIASGCLDSYFVKCAGQAFLNICWITQNILTGHHNNICPIFPITPEEFSSGANGGGGGGVSFKTYGIFSLLAAIVYSMCCMCLSACVYLDIWNQHWYFSLWDHITWPLVWGRKSGPHTLKEENAWLITWIRLDDTYENAFPPSISVAQSQKISRVSCLLWVSGNHSDETPKRSGSI